MFGTFINLIAAPKVAYEQLQAKPSLLLPMLALLGITAFTVFYYFHVSDPQLVIEDMLQQAGDDMSDAERAETRAGIESMGVNALKWASTMGGAVGLLIMLLLQALYYFIVSMFNGTKIGFKPWLSFSTWSYLPVLFASIAGVAALLLNPGHLPINELNPLSFASLLGFESTNASLGRFMESIDLTRLWSFAIMIIGYRVWTAKPWVHCLVVVLLPFLLIYGIWLAVIL